MLERVGKFRRCVVRDTSVKSEYRACSAEKMTQYLFEAMSFMEVIGTLIKRKLTGCITPSKIVRNNKIYTDKTDIGEQFNQYFINIGPQPASTIPQNNKSPMQFTFI